MDKEIIEAKKKYDFLRFTFIDIHGIGRCKTVPKSDFDAAFKKGAQFYVGSLGFGFKGELDACDAVTSKQKATNYQHLGNLQALPVTGTLHPLSAEGENKHRVGEILCETFHIGTGMRQEENPRYLAGKQLDQLQSLGYLIYSSFEVEFTLVDPETLKPVFDNIGEMFCCTTAERFDPILLDIMAELEAIGVEVETMQSEYSEGQFELVLKPQIGIKIADNLFITKNCIKAVARRHNLKAVFMTQKGDVHSCNGLHYNHSLRKISTEGNQYAFSDETDDLKLSQVCRWWLGGLIRHFRALNCICSPTFNCYRRLDQPWAPCVSSWGIDNRMEAYRVKSFSPVHTFIESRLPSGSANPYLILAVTVAAGIDGIKNKLPCPPPRPNVAAASDIYTEMELSKVPLTLAEALKALEEDHFIVDALGKDFVKWFVMLKEGEIKRLSGCDVKKNDPEMLAKERDLYMELL